MKKKLIQQSKIWACLLLACPIGATAQQTVFNDTFGGSTVSGISTNSGTFTASSTSYDIASGKNATPSTVGTKTASGHFRLAMPSTSSGYIEAQAVFSSYPITLALPGDSIDVQFTFTDTTNIFNGLSGNGTSLAVGLFNSGGSVPYTNLYNAGLSSSLSTAASGGVQNWLGYRGNIAYNPGASANAVVYSRVAQTQGNNLNQTLIQQGSGGFAGGASIASKANSWAGLTLTVGSQYTVDFNITLNGSGALLFTNTLYAGLGTSGTVLATNNGTATGANIVTTNFDSLTIGGERTGSVITTNDINQITVNFTSSAQAGPYFYVTGGSGCGSVDVGLSGSVSTNYYWLYTNGVNSRVSKVGTGSALDFGNQIAAATYTVVASNTATASMGPMFGNALVTGGSPTFSSLPASVACITNAIATFSANASGAGLGYQWYLNGSILTNGGSVSGAQTANLAINPASAAYAATVANGYYLVVTNLCGVAITSSPNASLTLNAPDYITWQGGNPNNNWDIANTLNFTNGTGSSVAFTNGDVVTFDDTSANTSVIITSNTTMATLINVTSGSSQSYIFGGHGSIIGASALSVNQSVTLTVTNNNSFTGGTVVTNTATLSLGDGSTQGKVAGPIVIYSGATLHNYLKNSSDYTLVGNNLSGNGLVIYEINGGPHTITIDPSETNSAFHGMTDIKSGTRLQVTTPYGLPGTNVTVEDNGSFAGSLYLNGSSITSSVAISIIGRGPATVVDNPEGMGALRINATVTGPITISGVDQSYNVTTIGASGGTGNIYGNITDNGSGYELEYMGGTLQVGPTNGPNIYGDTRITELLGGSSPNITAALTTVVALNTNAFSTNVLRMNGWTLLKMNGNNLQFSDLIDESAGGIGYNGSYTNITPEIVNGSTNASAVLTVGSDNNSQTFHGVLGNGSGKSLGLTKVGTGILTLSGDSTNTGPVTVGGGTLALAQASGTFASGSSFVGSGSFSNAAVFAVSSGATLDVSGRTDDTLALNSGQTLKGSGTVNGNVVANAGSTINPGDTIGALTVANNLTLAGAVLMELNRTNATATNDSIVTISGTITAGGTLTVTNLGPALHAGDSFQLFSTGVSGFFASTNLPAIDSANNVQYTWTSSLGTDGKITVASVTSLVNTNAPHLQVSVTGNTLNLAWPTNAGWTLLTNSVGLTATNQWFPYPNSANLTNVGITINPANANVFFQMKYPYP